MKRIALVYLLILIAGAVGIAALLQIGARLPAPAGAAKVRVLPSATPASAVDESALGALMTSVRNNLEEPLGRLFLQILVIIAVSRAFGALFAAIGQPSVVGEMAAGILLGPSFFGWIAPGIFHFVFPATSLGVIKLLSQIGVCLFMFAVGMELNLGHVRSKAQAAVMVSHASIVAPFLLGVSLAYFLYTRFAGPGATFVAFALFMGISMSITAFPVLARILQERGLTRTFLGSTAITCAAVDDVTAWSILAFVVAIAHVGSVQAAGVNLVLVALFVTVMVWGVRRLLPLCLGEAALTRSTPSVGALALVICVVLGSALCTELMGIHALFGAFLAGAIMPAAGEFRHKLAVRVETFSSVLLLPLFFVFTGLRTQVGLLSDVEGWVVALGIIAVATLGKVGGSAIAAKFTGMTWRDSLQLGALMNTRGLMELIALNIGYDLGILSPRIFAMLVIMALVTTTMTGPLLTYFGGRRLGD